MRLQDGAPRGRGWRRERPGRARSGGPAGARPPRWRAARGGSNPDVHDRDRHEDHDQPDRGIKEVLFEPSFGAVSTTRIAAASDRPAEPAGLGRLQEDAEHHEERQHEFNDAEKGSHGLKPLNYSADSVGFRSARSVRSKP